MRITLIGLVSLLITAGAAADTATRPEQTDPNDREQAVEEARRRPAPPREALRRFADRTRGQWRSPSDDDQPNGPDRRDQRGPRKGPRTLTAPQEKELDEFLAKHFPKIGQELRDHGRRDRPMFRKIASRLRSRLWDLYQAYKLNPELGEVLIEQQRVEFNIRRLSRAMRVGQATPAEAEPELRELIERQFDLKLHRRQIELEALEVKLKAQRERLEQFKRIREKYVDQLLKDVLTPQDRHAPGPRRRPQTASD